MNTETDGKPFAKAFVEYLETNHPNYMKDIEPLIPAMTELIAEYQDSDPSASDMTIALSTSPPYN